MSVWKAFSGSQMCSALRVVELGLASGYSNSLGAFSILLSSPSLITVAVTEGWCKPSRWFWIICPCIEQHSFLQFAHRTWEQTIFGPSPNAKKLKPRQLPFCSWAACFLPISAFLHFYLSFVRVPPVSVAQLYLQQGVEAFFQWVFRWWLGSAFQRTFGALCWRNAK